LKSFVVDTNVAVVASYRSPQAGLHASWRVSMPLNTLQKMVEL